jgi:hypothetical protein
VGAQRVQSTEAWCANSAASSPRATRSPSNSIQPRPLEPHPLACSGDGGLPMANNAAERAVRGIAIRRRIPGGRRTATMYTADVMYRLIENRQAQ